jgi:hypothetical protein
MRFILSLLIAFALLIIITVGFGPAIVSTGWGKSMAVKAVNHFSGYSLKVDMLRLSWMDGQQMSGVELLDHKGKVVFRCDDLTTDATLIQLLARNEIGHMKAVAPKITVEPQFSSNVARLHQAGLVPSFSIRAHLPQQLNGYLVVEKGEVDFLSPGLDPIQLQNIALSLEIPKTGPLNIKGTGQTVQNKVLGQFDLEGMLDDKIELKAHLANFPTRAIDQTVAIFHPNLRGVLTAAVGDALNVDLQAKTSQEILEVALDASAPNFKAHVQTKSDDNTVSLQSPAVIAFTANPSFVAKFIDAKLLKPVALALKVDAFEISLADQEAFTVQGSLSLSDIQLPDAVIQPAVLTLASDNSKEGKFTATLASSQLTLQAMHFQWKDGLTLLSPVTFSGVASGTISKLVVPLNWRDLQAEAAINWQGKAAFSINTLKSVGIDYTTSQLPSPLPPLPSPLPPLLSQPATIHIAFDPIASFDTFKGTAFVDSVSLQDVSLQNLQAPFQFDRRDNSGAFQLSGAAGSGTINTQISFKNGQYQASGRLKKFPVHLFEILLNQKNLAATAGPLADLSFNASGKKEAFQASLQGDTDLLMFDLNLQLANNVFTLTKPGTVSYTLTPDGYKALDLLLNKTAGPFDLKENASLNLSLANLQLPAAAEFDPAKVQLQGDLTASHIAFVEKSTGQATSLTNIKLSFAQPALNSPLSFNLNADVEPKGRFFSKGTFDHATGSTAFDLSIDQFPSSVLDLAARSIGKARFSPSVIFGSTVNATASAKIQNWAGPLKINVNSPNTRASLDGMLQNGILTLNDSIYAQITMTPALSQMVLKEVNPLSISSLRALHPFTLEIPPAGFSVQLHPFAMSGVTIPNGRIELGQIFCQNEGNLNAALALLKLSQFSNQKEIRLWFAPIDFHIAKGVVDCERTEILVADAFDICTWGKVDLVKDYVDMILGLTASCLKNAFGIKDLPSDYVLQIPMKGPTDNVKIDSGKATSKVAALLLWQQKSLAGSIAGGPAGALIGELMSKLGPLPDSDAKAPPAKRPFPWETSAAEEPHKKHTSEAEPVHKKKKHFKNDEKPLKQLLKMLK